MIRTLTFVAAMLTAFTLLLTASQAMVHLDHDDTNAHQRTLARPVAD